MGIALCGMGASMADQLEPDSVSLWVPDFHQGRHGGCGRNRRDGDWNGIPADESLFTGKQLQQV
jgi:hypothetical protein